LKPYVKPAGIFRTVSRDCRRPCSGKFHRASSRYYAYR